MSSIKGIVKAYVLRAEACISTVLRLSVLLGIVMSVLLIITGLYAPNLYTPLTRHALYVLAREFLGTSQISPKDITIIIATIFEPFFAAIMATFIASGYLVNTIGKDRFSGVFEVLLSYPISIKDLLVGLIMFSIYIAALSYIPITVITTGIVVTTLSYLSSPQFLNLYIDLTLLLLPSIISCILISILIVFTIPKIIRIKTGLLPVQNLATLISILPILVPILILNIIPTISPYIIALLTFASSIALSVLILLILPRIIRPLELIITS
ncbi:MAG: hypothetical protein GXO26_07610 [Crenarchaeota archaeon]|nr:hypothetical protein [Thermoproteota archaeon]